MNKRSIASKTRITGAKFNWRHPKATFKALTLTSLLPIMGVFILMSTLGGYVTISLVSAPTLNVTPSATANSQIPRQYLAVYEDVANQDEVPWTILAALGEELTKQGSTSPYDSITRKMTYPSVSPPIGNAQNPKQGAGPFLLNSSAVTAVGGFNKAQNMQTAIGYIGYQLEKDAQVIASNQQLSYETELVNPISETSSFWVQAVAELPIQQTTQSCAPPSGESVAAEIESIWACELTAKTVHLEEPNGLSVSPSNSSNQLIVEALQVSSAYSNWGAKGDVFPLPAKYSSDSGNQVSDITEAARLVIAAAMKPLSGRVQSEWEVLPGVVVPSDTYKSSLDATAPDSSACQLDLENAISKMSEPGPFSPNLIQSTGKANPNALTSVWKSSSLYSLRLNPDCFQLSSPSAHATSVSISDWEQLVATAAQEILEIDESTLGSSASFSNLSGLLTYLDTVAKIPTATSGKTTLVPRLADPPIADLTASTNFPIPSDTAGQSAEVASIASTYDGTPGAVTLSASNISSISGVPQEWVIWAGQATAAECPNLSPLVLLGIGENESTWGESTLPGVASGSNYAGAEGPMQFMPATFAAYAVTVNGETPSPYNPEDALFAAAKYLCSNGAGTKWQPAVEQYCGGGPGTSSTAQSQCAAYVASIEKDISTWQQSATLLSAALPSGVIGKFITTAEAQIGLPYNWGGQTAGVGFDCSGLVDFGLLQAGIDPSGVYLGANGSHGATAQQLFNATQAHIVTDPTQLQPGDLLFFGSSVGNIGHVGIYVGNGEMVDAPSTGQDVQTQPYMWPDFLIATSLGTPTPSN